MILENQLRGKGLFSLPSFLIVFRRWDDVALLWAGVTFALILKQRVSCEL